MELTLRCNIRQYSYLKKNFGSSLTLPYSNSKVASYIFLLIKKSKSKQTHIQKEYTHKFTVHVPIWVYTKYGVTDIDDDVTHLINIYLQEKFREAFFLRLHELAYIARPRMMIIQAIYHLIAFWEIDEDVNVESIKKEYYRYRKKHHKIFKKHTTVNVPDVLTRYEQKQDDLLTIRINSEVKSQLINKLKGRSSASELVKYLIQNYINA